MLYICYFAFCTVLALLKLAVVYDQIVVLSTMCHPLTNSILNRLQVRCHAQFVKSNVIDKTTYAIVYFN